MPSVRDVSGSVDVGVMVTRISSDSKYLPKVNSEYCLTVEVVNDSTITGNPET
jgi:hypothetical protein